MRALSHQSNAVSLGCGNVPHAAFPARVGFREVGTVYGTRRVTDLELTASLLTVVLVLVKRKAAVTGTFVRTDSILTQVLTTSVILCAFIAVYKTTKMSKVTQIRLKTIEKS